MNGRFARVAKLAASGIFFASLLSVGTGCGAIKAATNPKSAWALSDPAPMAVVVRRADAAEGTAKEVDRLLTSTPAAPDAAWVVATAPTDDEQKKDGEAIANHTLYVQSQARIVSAELWARSLPTRKGDGKTDDKASSAAGAPATKIAKADKPAKKKNRKADAKTDARAAEADAGKKTDVGTTTLTGAEVPAAKTAARAGSLLAAIDPALADKYAVVMAKKKEVADLRAQIAAEDAAADEKGVAEADKKAHKEKATELGKKADAAEAEATQLAKDFVPAAKAAAQKAGPEIAAKYGPTLVALRQAVVDANTANGAAAMKYPLALPTLKDSATQMIGVYVSDVIEEKTGKRPDLRTFQPGLTLDGTNVQVTLNGLTPEDMGKLKAGDVTKEVADREQKWVKHAVMLMGAISSNKEILGFEEDVLGALVDGLTAGGWKASAAPILKEPPPAKPQPQGAPARAAAKS
jgi:hypothetical protein